MIACRERERIVNGLVNQVGKDGSQEQGRLREFAGPRINEFAANAHVAEEKHLLFILIDRESGFQRRFSTTTLPKPWRDSKYSCARGSSSIE